MKCENCQLYYTDEAMFCSACGARLTEEKEPLQCAENICPNCGTAVEQKGQNFCAACGFDFRDSSADVDNTSPTETLWGLSVNSVGNKLHETFESVSNSPFVSALKEDFKQSQAVNMVKSEVSNRLTEHKENRENETEEKTARGGKNKVVGICAVAALLVVTIACIVSNLHTCAECGKNYLGRTYVVWGEEVCKDCYEEWISF